MASWAALIFRGIGTACRRSPLLNAPIKGAISGVRTHIAVSRPQRTLMRRPQEDALAVRSGFRADEEFLRKAHTEACSPLAGVRRVRFPD